MRAAVERRSVWIAAALAVILLTAGGVYSDGLGGQLRFLPDEQDYLTLAENLAAGRGFTLDGVAPTAYRAPAYPALLAAFTWLDAPPWALRWVNYWLLAGTAALAYAWFHRRGDRLAGVLAALLAALNPLAFFTAGTFYPQTLAGLLFLAALNLAAGREPDLKSAALAGLAAGALALTVPTFLTAMLILAAALLLRRPWPGLVFLAMLVLVVGAWVGRNAAVMGGGPLLATNVGENLLLGNAPGARPNSGVNVDITAERAAAAGMSEVERDRYFAARAYAAMRTRPLETFGLYLAKTANYFNFRNELATAGVSSVLREALAFLSYYPVLILAGLRLLPRRQPPLDAQEKMLALLYVSNALAAAVFFTRLRLRVPYDYLIALLAAGFLSAWITRQTGSATGLPISRKQ